MCLTFILKLLYFSNYNNNCFGFFSFMLENFLRHSIFEIQICFLLLVRLKIEAFKKQTFRKT